MGFSETLAKQQLKTFSSVRKPLRVTVKSKEKSIVVDRDLLARIVTIAKSREVDLGNLFQCELTTVPLSTAKLDGSLNKTAKSVLLHQLEKNTEVLPNLPGANISSMWAVDGMALIQMIRGSKAKTFGELTQTLFEIIQNIMSMR